jgi:hypothetical protein
MVSEIELLHRTVARKDALKGATRHVLIRAAKSADVNGGIFENVLPLVTTAWRVLRLRMEETASRYGG